MLGHHEEAVRLTREGVERYRRLAAGNPAADSLDLALTLENLGARLADAGRPAEAVAPAEEGAAIRR